VDYVTTIDLTPVARSTFSEFPQWIYAASTCIFLCIYKSATDWSWDSSLRVWKRAL